MNETERAHWLAARCGKLTASRMATAMAFKKDGSPAKERSDYMRELLAERITGLSVRHYVNAAMEHGLEYEDEAKRAYEAHTGILLDESRFYEHPTIENFGATPDAEIDHDGLAEIKCPTTTTFIVWRMFADIPEEHKPQMLAQLACTGREWCDFVAYDPRLKEPGMRLIVRRFTPEPAHLTSIELIAVRFLSELDELFDEFVTA